MRGQIQILRLWDDVDAQRYREQAGIFVVKILCKFLYTLTHLHIYFPSIISHFKVEIMYRGEQIWPGYVAKILRMFAEARYSCNFFGIDLLIWKLSTNNSERLREHESRILQWESWYHFQSGLLPTSVNLCDGEIHLTYPYRIRGDWMKKRVG